jgi:hypothetical protein
MTATPDTSARLTDENGRISETWVNFFKTLIRSQTSFSGSVTELTTSKASASQPYAEAMLIEYPENKDYVFVSLAIEGTIEEVVAKTASGACTVTVYINDQPLGGDSNSANTTQTSQKHTTRNELTTNDDITITISNNATAAGCSITIRGTKAYD